MGAGKWIGGILGFMTMGPLGTYNLTTTYLGTKDGNQAFTDSGTVVTIIERI